MGGAPKSLIISNLRTSKKSEKKSKKVLTFLEKCAIIFPVSERNNDMIMTERLATKFVLTWRDEDSGRVNSKEFVNEIGKDHSGSMAALNMAQVIDGNLWPWIIEKNGKTMCHGWGGNLL
jgi:hypothetical protein